MREKGLTGQPTWAFVCSPAFNTRCVISGQTQEVRKPLFGSCFLSVTSPTMQACR